jgi:hypothetical protein
MQDQPLLGPTSKKPYKIAFMHIPKTAGSSVVKAFEARFGWRHCEAFSPMISDASFIGKAFVSGHVPRSLINADAFIFTFLRNPYDQIVSHLKWLDHYNIREFQPETELFPESVRAAFRRIAGVDFADAASIRQYLDWVEVNAPLQFANVQSAMLGLPTAPVSAFCKKDLARLTIDRLQSFDFIGISEDVQKDLGELFKILRIRRSPKVAHENRSPARRSIDLSNPEIRKLLRDYVDMDLYVYGTVMRLRSLAAAGRSDAIPIRQNLLWRDALARLGELSDDVLGEIFT